MPPPHVSGVGLAEELPNDYSDGDSTTWPGAPYARTDDSNYRSALATQWLEERGTASRGFTYRFKQLPKGYALFEIPKPDHSGVVYKRLFGHPSGRYYDSSRRFYPHFKWLQGGGQGSCSCKFCDRTGNVAAVREPKPRQKTNNILDIQPVLSEGGSRTRPRVEDRALVDEEGTPDPYRALLQKLQKLRRINEVIRENQSMDWRAEREVLPQVLARLSLQHSFLPRIGELVLWMPEMDGDLILDGTTGRYQLYSFADEKYLGFPEWRAGLITEIPEEAGDFQDLVLATTKNAAVNVSGYRVETFPDPNDDTNKSYSKHYKYIPLRQIRPLSYWQILLRGMDQEKMHPSVKNALTIMSSVSLVEKFKFRGIWPEAEIFCKGLFLGAEFLVVGDAVRILPNEESSTACADILVISSIRLQLHEITQELAYSTQPSKLSTKMSVHVYGKAFTRTASRSYASDRPDGRPLTSTEMSTLFPSVGLSSLGAWYRLHPPHSRYEISFDRILGRLHEPSGTCLMLNKSVSDIESSEILSYDLAGVRASRQYGAATDARIPEDGSWFLGDSRAQVLAVETFNGLEVGNYDDDVRTQEALNMWRANLRVIDGIASEQDRAAVFAGATLGPTSLLGGSSSAGMGGDGFGSANGGEAYSAKRRGRKPGGKVVNGKVVYPGMPQYDLAGANAPEIRPSTSKMVIAALDESTDDDADDENDEGDVGKEQDARGDASTSGVTKMQGLSLDGGIRKPIGGGELDEEDDGDKGEEDDDDDAEEGQDDDSDVIIDDAPLPVERGGTEESEGGDYQPLLETFQTGSSSKRPEKRARY